MSPHNVNMLQFQKRKHQTLYSKRDKSSAGRLDPKVVEICSVINARSEYYTTSSCSGRCFLYVGDGIKSWHHYQGSKSNGFEGSELNSEDVNMTTPSVVGTDDANSGGTMKSTIPESTTVLTGKLGFFQRYRVNHDLVTFPQRYFDLTSIASDPTGGGDPIPTVGQYDFKKNEQTGDDNVGSIERHESNFSDDGHASLDNGHGTSTVSSSEQTIPPERSPLSISISPFVPTTPIWLRYEPFILHVMCNSLRAASKLMALARPSFKNVGLTSWSDSGSNASYDSGVSLENYYQSPLELELGVNSNLNDTQQSKSNQQCKGGGPRYLVAIWGDEGLDMPLSLPCDPSRGLFYHPNTSNDERNGGPDESCSGMDNAAWLAQLVNDRHIRNWDKINRFVEAVRNLSDDEIAFYDDREHQDTAFGNGVENGYGQYMDSMNDVNDNKDKKSKLFIPRSYDVVGDVAILNALPQVPEGVSEEEKENIYHKVGELVLGRNKAIKICLARANSLSTQHRTPGNTGYITLAGPSRNPLITTHVEYGIKSVIDLQHTFFSPRMAPERLRLSQQVARGERVLVVFAGVGMEALQISARTEVREIVCVERNEVAVECLRRGKRMLERNKSVTRPGGGREAAERLKIVEGDALEVLPGLEKGFDRIVAPRPKEGDLDGDLGSGDAGTEFLLKMLPLLKIKGEVHWYDFAADHELPRCERTRRTVEGVCKKLGIEMEVLHVARAGSVAKRQWRICMDFRIIGSCRDQ